MGIVSIIIFWGFTLCTGALITVGEVQRSGEIQHPQQPARERRVCVGDMNTGVVCSSWDVQLPSGAEKPF